MNQLEQIEKKFSAILISILFLTLVACGSSPLPEPYEPEQSQPYETAPHSPTQEPYRETSPATRRTLPAPQGSWAYINWDNVAGMGITRKEFIADFDYMLYVLEENYPFFGAIYRRLGVDMRAQAAQLRETLADENYYLDMETFIYLLRRDFIEPAAFIGHLNLVSPAGFHARLNLLTDINHTYHPNWPALNHPASLEFYGEAALGETLLMPHHQLLGYDENLILEILEPGRIAYFRMVTMRASGQISFDPDIERMSAIYEEIRGFEHLIIDIRGNPGGQMLFDFLVLAPHLDEVLSVPMYGFYMGGAHNLRFLDGWIHNPQNRRNPDLNLPYFDPADLQLIDYVYADPWTVDPNRRGIPLPYPRFDGKIWLLIDGGGFSMAERAAFMSKQTGFITLVGEQSGGVVGGTEATWIAMPNSGVLFSYDAIRITDQYGRCLNEVPTQPHYFNRPGMDALETVLAIIAEST